MELAWTVWIRFEGQVMCRIIVRKIMVKWYFQDSTQTMVYTRQMGLQPWPPGQHYGVFVSNPPFFFLAPYYYY